MCGSMSFGCPLVAARCALAESSSNLVHGVFRKRTTVFGVALQTLILLRGPSIFAVLSCSNRRRTFCCWWWPWCASTSRSSSSGRGGKRSVACVGRDVIAERRSCTIWSPKLLTRIINFPRNRPELVVGKGQRVPQAKHESQNLSKGHGVRTALERCVISGRASPHDKRLRGSAGASHSPDKRLPQPEKY